jgi:hypothetical protein
LLIEGEPASSPKAAITPERWEKKKFERSLRCIK